MIETNIIYTILICLAAGVHAASYGAWKDSPSESYLPRRTIRELVFSLLIGIVFVILHLWETENYFVLYLAAYTCNRALTEFWKLFIRVEPQEGYREPTQIHYLGRVVDNPILRILFGLIPVSVAIGLYFLTVFLINNIEIHTAGILIGLIYGVADALGGAYKDGYIQGFRFYKFVKSPTLGMLGGFITSHVTTTPFFLLVGSIAIARQLVELFFKIMSDGYVPGKFKSLKPVYPYWKKRRTIFLYPYIATWILFIILWLRWH